MCTHAITYALYGTLAKRTQHTLTEEVNICHFTLEAKHLHKPSLYLAPKIRLNMFIPEARLTSFINSFNI